MLFLNGWLLSGLLAVSIPVIIHLLNRRSARVVDWGAMQFLLDSVMRRRRRVLIEEMLLLACRCLLVALLALALARPFIPAGSTVPWIVVLPLLLMAITLFGVSFAMWRYPRWRRNVMLSAIALALLAGAAVAIERQLNLRRFGGETARDVAIVIDGSSSMTMTVDGRTNFERAISEVERFIEEAPRGVAFSLVLGGPVPVVVTSAPVSDRGQLYRLLDSLQPTLGSMQALDALAAAAFTLAQGYNPMKQIVVIGDSQQVGWGTDSPDSWRHLREAFRRLPSTPQVVFRQLPLPLSYRNLAVAEITLSRVMIGTDRDVRINVRVVNTGTEAVTPQAVELTSGGRVYSDISLGQLEPGVSREVVFFHRFDHPGAHVVEARIVVDDELPADDSLLRVVPVMERFPVLVVDGNPTARFADRAAGFVALSLAPDASRIEARLEPQAAAEFLVEPEWVGAGSLTARTSFHPYGAVILADVPRLPSAVAERLAAYVAGGGGLLVATGERAQSDFYNHWRHADGAVLPLIMEASVLSDGTQDGPSPAPESFSHNALRPLRDGSGIERVVFDRYWRLDDSMPARVGGRLSNGQPWLGMRALGEGSVLQLATPLDASAGNLVSQRAFVPLVHELVYALARPMGVNLNVQPSRGLTLHLDPSRSAAVDEDEDAVSIWTAGISDVAIGPDGNSIPVEYFSTRDDRLALRIEQNIPPGLYRARVPEALRVAMKAFMDGEATIPINVSTGVDESFLRRLSADDIAFIAQFVDLRVADNDDDVLRALAGSAFGRELWRILALAALLLVVGEVALTRWIAIQRGTGEEETLTFGDSDRPTERFREELNRMRGGQQASGVA